MSFKKLSRAQLLEQYETLFNFSPSGILLEDDMGTIIDINPSFCEKMGYTRSELIGKNIRILAHPDVENDVNGNIKKLLDGNQLRHVQKSLRKDGTYAYMWLNENRITLSDGSIGIICIAEDITSRVEAEQALRKSEEKYRLLIDNQTDLVVKVDTEGKFLFVSPSYCDMFGKTEEQLLGQKFMPMVHKDDRTGTSSAMKYLFEPPYNAYMEQRAMTKYGWRWLSWMDTAVLDEDNNVKEIIGVGRDITERKIVQEALLNSEESYRGLFNSATDAIYIQDKDGKFVDVNEGAIKMYGYPREYFIGKTPEFLSAPGKNNLKEMGKRIHEAFDGTPQRFEFWGIDKNGKEFPKEIRMSNGKYFDKKVIIAFAQDISERKLAEESIRESKRRMSTLMDNLPGMAYRCLNDKNWTMEFVSNGCKELTGHDSDDLIANRKVSYNDLIVPEDRDTIWKGVQKSLREKTPFRLNYRIKNASGQIKWVWEQGTGIYTKKGELIALEGFITDVTEQKNAEVEIRKLSSSVEQSPTIIVITDLNGIIEYVNPIFCKITGYSSEEVIGRNPRILQSGKTPEITYTTLWQTIKSGKEWKGEFLNKRKDNSFYWESAHIFPLKDINDNITHFIAMKEDITERKMMEEALINAKLKAEESDKLKSAFLANMSHEIRTPMNSIIGFSQLLNEPGTAPEEQEHYINLIQSSGNDLLNLIDDIIDISKIEAGQLKVFKSQYFLDNILKELFDSFNEYIKTKQEKNEITLKYSKPAKGEKVVIYTDIDRFKQIVRNLISNAIKFTDFGMVEFGFKLAKKASKPVIKFFVSDTGIGIPEQKLKLIFESFRQASYSNSKLYGGTGLGLAITKRMVSILGGDIWVESVEGQGSTFYFTLPYNPVSNYNLSVDEESLKKTNKKYNWENKQVLIVEDDDQSYFFYKKVLSRTKIKIIRANDGYEALNQCKNTEINIVLMDIHLPKMDGYSATKQIKKLKPDLPVIAQTAFALADEKKKCFEAGCDDYISKPIKINSFLDLIHKFLDVA